MDWTDVPETRIAVAFAIGLLVGAERERRRAAQASGGFAGLRTFGLAGLFGGVLAYLGPTSLVIAGMVLVGLVAVAAYVVHREEEDRGVTTELALVVTYALGALALTRPVVAAGWAVMVAGVLALRGWLHRLVRETLSEDELRDGLVFLLVALIVLPIAPDVAMGPYDAVNPQSVARLVVVLMGVTGFGYVAQRILGRRYGLTFAGFAGGFVSSSATIAALGMRARDVETPWRGAVAGALASTVATAVQYGVIIATVDPPLALHLALPLGLAGLVALAWAGTFTWLAARGHAPAMERGRAFYFGAALGFAAVVTLVAIVSAALEERIGRAGIVLVSGVAALVDAHSTAGSVAAMHSGGRLETSTAELAILTALSANTLTKIAMAWTSRHRAYAASVTVGVVLVAFASWVPHLLR